MDSFMSKTIKKCFYNKLTFQKMLEAHYRAVKNKKNKKEVVLYEMDLENNIINLIDSIKNKTYHLGKYREFKVYEPKERLIKSLPYRDRIVHQWYVEEFIKPYFTKRFIKDSYACIETKGTHKAEIVLQKYMRIMKRKYGSYYILKCDIKKYFYNINKDILFSILKRSMSDKELLNFTLVLLNSEDKVGIPIGNYTSQYFANIYLNELDHYVKETLRISYYVRYMDDFVFLLPNKEIAKETMKKIENFIHTELQLELNQKSKYYPSTMGCNFCGYRIYETHILLRTRFKTKAKKNIKKWNQLYATNSLNLAMVWMSWNSMLAHASHASAYYFIVSLYKKAFFSKYLKKYSYYDINF